MQVSVVTSCSAAGWKEMGAKCVSSMHQFWPKNVALHVVSEDALPIDPMQYPGREVTFWNLLDKNSSAAAFYQRHRDNAAAHGKLPRAPRQQNGYSFRHDAFKFSKKVFAIETVAWAQKTGRLIWLDADTVTFKKIPDSLIMGMPPEGCAVAHLWRKSYHSECGFIGYNLDHPGTLKFIIDLAALYATDRVFSLQEWHDSWVFDYLLQRQGIPAYKIPHNSNPHPFVFSELGNYMDHKKGARKRYTYSPDHPVLRKIKRVTP